MTTEQRPDERVEDEQFTAEQLASWRKFANDAMYRAPEAWTLNETVHSVTVMTGLLIRLDEQRARAERLDDIIEFIRTYDPKAVDDAEAQYPAANES